MVYHNYIFFKSDSLFNELPSDIRKKYEQEFLKVLAGNKNIRIHTYATLGVKVNTNMVIWFQADTIETIQNHLNALMHTHLGRYIQITYTLFGMTRPTQYSPNATAHLDTNRKGGSYLIIYPFSKTKEWYMLDGTKRKALMGGHIAIGRKHPQIRQLLLYSYGIDDNEFIVSYETDELPAFQTLVMELRMDKVRAYTHKDTPIFTCIYKSPEEVLNFL